MREIVLDTETTGLDPLRGDRLVEIGCIELLNRIPTGQTFHRYLNPERDVPAEAFAVHGLSREFLADKPLFAEVVADLLAFIGDAPLVIHNAGFDVGFINAELERCGKPWVARERLIDTLLLARRKYAGGKNSLDDLCGRFGIDNSKRTKHGALLDAELLADVYLELIEALRRSLGSPPPRSRPPGSAPRRTRCARASSNSFRASPKPSAPPTAPSSRRSAVRRSGTTMRRKRRRPKPLRPEPAAASVGPARPSADTG